MLQMAERSFKDTVSFLPVNNSTFRFQEKQPIFFISPEFFSTFTYLVNIILTPVVCIIGLTGNGMGLYLLSKEPSGRTLTFNTYLKALLWVDSLYLVLGIIIAIVDVINLHLDNGNFLGAHFEPYKIFFDALISVLSVCMVIILSLERLISLLRPFTVKSFFLSRHPTTVIFITFIISAGSIVFLPMTTTVITFKNFQNETEYMLGLKPEYQKVQYWYSIVFIAVVHNIFPGLVLILNISILISFLRYTRKQATNLRSNKSKDNQGKITIIVVCVAGLYVILSIPNVFSQVLSYIDNDYNIDGLFKFFFFFFLHLGDFLLRVNAAADFLIYLVVNSNFRSSLKTKCCKRHKRKSGQTFNSLESNKNGDLHMITSDH